jgi:hypothetical protein
MEWSIFDVSLGELGKGLWMIISNKCDQTGTNNKWMEQQREKSNWSIHGVW